MPGTALRALPVADTEPPVDDPRLAPSGRRAAPPPPGRGVQGVLALVVDNDPVTAPGDELDFGPQATATRDLPPAGDWGRRLIQVLVEVMCGQRPAPQLLRWTSQAVYAEVLAQTLPHPRATAPVHRRRPRVSSVRVCQPVDGVAELSAVVRGQHRVQAVAVRLEGRDGRWQATAIETG